MNCISLTRQCIFLSEAVQSYCRFLFKNLQQEPNNVHQDIDTTFECVLRKIIVSLLSHRCTGGLKKNFDLWLGFQRHRHFVGFFNVAAQAPTRGQPFYGYSEKPPNFSRLLRRAWGHHTAITNCPFKFAFSHLPKALFSMWATFAAKVANILWWRHDNRKQYGKCAWTLIRHWLQYPVCARKTLSDVG